MDPAHVYASYDASAPITYVALYSTQSHSSLTTLLYCMTNSILTPAVGCI